MDDNIITVIIPTYNRVASLERAIASVLQETRIQLRVAVLDDASTDGTEALLQRLSSEDDRVSFLRNATNIGSIPNYQKVFGLVKTAYFVPLADDDYLLEGFLFKAHQIMEDDQTLVAAVFYAEERDEDGLLERTWPHDRNVITFGKLTPAEHLRDWMRNCHYVWSSVLWRSDMLAEIGPPYLHTGLPSDVDFQARIFCTGNVELVDEPGAVYSSHAGQSSRTINIIDIGSWASIFARLDALVLGRKILEFDEYMTLRHIMWTRYRPGWGVLPATPLDGRQARQCAAIAGFRLGDWALAFALTDQAEQKGSAAVRSNNFLALPSETDPDGVRWVPGRFGDLVHHAILWFKQAIVARKALEGELAAKSDQLLDAERRGAALASEVAALSADLALWQARYEAAAARHARLAAHPLVRAFARMGIIRNQHK